MQMAPAPRGRTAMMEASQFARETRHGAFVESICPDLLADSQRPRRVVRDAAPLAALANTPIR